MIGNQLGLWRKLTSSNHPKDLVEYDLKKSTESIALGILSYEKQRDEKSLKELKSKKYGADQLKFILELSELLGLDELLCQKFFTAWLINEYRDTPDNLKTWLADERSRYNLLSRLVAFYYSDRIYCHLTLKQLISHAHNQQHPFQSVYAKFIDGLEIKASGRIYQLLLAEYETLYNKEPLELYDSPLRHILTAEHQSSWSYQVLKEQVLVLETLLTYLYYKPTVDQSYLHDLVTKFKTKALTGQPHTTIKHCLTELHQPLLARLEQLQVLIVLVSMKLDDTRAADHPLNEQVPSLHKLDVMFGTRLAEFPSYGPLVLGWAVTRCGQVAPEVIGNLGDTALRLNVFSYIRDLLNDLEPQEITNQLSIITVYQLMTKVLALFDDSALDDGSTITDIVCRLLTHECVADLVLQAGAEDAVYRYITASLNVFPLTFHPSINMLAAAARSSKSAAIHVVKLLLSVPSFTEYLDANSQTNVQFLLENQVELLEDKPLFREVLLPAGTIGMTADSDGPPTIQWRYSFNAWDLLSWELAVVCSQPHLVADVSVQKKLLSTTGLMAATFEHAPISGTPAELIHDSLYRIIYGLSSLETPPTEVIASCIDLATSLATFTPSMVIENMAVVFLPFVSSTNNDRSRPWMAEIQRSLLGHILYSTECALSVYPVLISTLKLVCTALTTSQDPLVRERLVPVVLYVLRDVLTAYNGWRYSDVSERDTIGELCVEMVHSILNTSSGSNDVLSKACTRTLLHTNAGHTILNMISLGSEILDLVILEQASVQVTSCLSREGKPSTVYRLGLCLSLLRRLLIIARDVGEETVLQSCLSSKASQSQRHITRVIASYTYHRHSTRLPILSTQLLNVIAQESQMSMLSSFGEDAYSIRSGFLRRLALRSEDPRFKVVLVELLTTCVENQPGLLELFLSANTDTEEPLLNTTQQLIEADKQLTHICPGDLLLAGLNFVLALWSAGRERVTQKLATSKSFWKTVVTPLGKKMGDLSSGSTSHPLKAKIYCNVLQLLSYQLYQRDAAAKEFDALLKSVSQPQWADISGFVRSELSCLNSDVSEISDETLRHSAAVHLLDSYRMFLSTAQLAAKELFDASTCLSVMSDVLATMSHLLAGFVTPTCQRLVSMLSSMCFELFTKWHSHLLEWEPSYQQLAQILHSATNGGADIQVVPNVLIGIVATIQLLTTKKIRRQSTQDTTTDSTESILSCVSNLLPVCCSQLAAGVSSSSSAGANTDSPTAHEKLRVVLLSALFALIDKLPESVWIARLHESYAIPSLLNSLAHNIKTHTDLPYVESCIALLTHLSTKQSRSKLVSSSLSEHLSLTVSSLYSSNGMATGDNSSVTTQTSWQRQIGPIVDIYSFLLTALAHSFVSDAATFIAVHTDRIMMLIESLSVTLNEDCMTELRAYIHLISCLAKHQHQWMTETSCAKVKHLLAGVCYLSQDCVALLHRPKAIQHMLLKQTRGKQKNVEKLDNVDISQTHRSLLDMLAECCRVMNAFTPDLCLLLNDVTFDVLSYEPLVAYGFTSPSLENKAPPTFGSFISTTSLCISMLTKSERSPSRSQLSDEEVEVMRPRLLYILEITVYLILTQVLLYLRAGVLGQKETNLLKREIGTELNACILGIQRYYRKLHPPSPGTRGATTPGVTGTGSTPAFSSATPAKSPRNRGMHSPALSSLLAEHGLYKLADQFIKKVLK